MPGTADVRTRHPHLNRPRTYRWHMAEIRIVGAEVRTELDVHRSLERQLEFGEYYGRNVAALRDRLLTDVPRPVVSSGSTRTSVDRASARRSSTRSLGSLPRRRHRISRSVGTNNSSSSFNSGRLEPACPTSTSRAHGSGSPLCQVRVLDALECVLALVAVKVVRPVGRSTSTAPARRRGRLTAPGRAGFRTRSLRG